VIVGDSVPSGMRKKHLMI
jgi:hypothetical protein